MGVETRFKQKAINFIYKMKCNSTGHYQLSVVKACGCMCVQKQKKQSRLKTGCSAFKGGMKKRGSWVWVWAFTEPWCSSSSGDGPTSTGTWRTKDKPLKQQPNTPPMQKEGVKKCWWISSQLECNLVSIYINHLNILRRREIDLDWLQLLLFFTFLTFC